MSRNRPANVRGSVRRRLARVTQCQHQALHTHTLSRALLAEPTAAVLTAHLRTAWRFCAAVESERCRLNLFPTLTLAEPLALLTADLDGCSDSATNAFVAGLGFADGPSLLGALYVAHGAQFGRVQLARQLEALGLQPLPAYFQQSPDGQRWKQLLDVLDQCGRTPAGYAAVERGARRAFSAYADLLNVVTAPTGGLLSAPASNDAEFLASGSRRATTFGFHGEQLARNDQSG